MHVVAYQVSAVTLGQPGDPRKGHPELLTKLAEASAVNRYGIATALELMEARGEFKVKPGAGPVEVAPLPKGRGVGPVPGACAGAASAPSARKGEPSPGAVAPEPKPAQNPGEAPPHVGVTRGGQNPLPPPPDEDSQALESALDLALSQTCHVSSRLTRRETCACGAERYGGDCEVCRGVGLDLGSPESISRRWADMGYPDDRTYRERFGCRCACHPGKPTWNGNGWTEAPGVKGRCSCESTDPIVCNGYKTRRILSGLSTAPVPGKLGKPRPPAILAKHVPVVPPLGPPTWGKITTCTCGCHSITTDAVPGYRLSSDTDVLSPCDCGDGKGLEDVREKERPKNRENRSRRSCASTERVATGRASKRLMPISSPVSRQ